MRNQMERDVFLGGRSIERPYVPDGWVLICEILKRVQNDICDNTR
jgi:hypothetical protein